MADLSGHILGRYQVLERLGRGGMADVYRAYQSGLDRYVAIKVMHSHLSEEGDFITRFQREAKAVASLRHPHIVQVFDFDVQDGVYFMVMEYIEGGQTLKELLSQLASRGEHLPLRTVLDLTAKLADALDYAHQRGMIHRDLKPSNVLLTTPSHPVLSDFGIARLVGQTGLTGTGAMIGTPAYMSPEQGRGEQADERSDIYALGIILYEVLTGQPPYDADTPYGVILKHINDPLVPPRNLVSGLPEAAERVVLKCLAKSPEDRYQTAGELRSALEAALKAMDDQTPVSFSTPPAGLPSPDTQEIALQESSETLAAPILSTTQRPLRKVRWWMIAAPVGLIALVGAVILAVFLSSRGDAGEAADGLGDDVQEIEDDEPSAEEASDLDALLERAFEQWDNGEDEEAFGLFAEILADDPDNTEALVSQALIRLEQGAPGDTEALLAQAQETAPDDAYVAFGFGLLHIYGEGYYDAEAALGELGRAAAQCGDLTELCVAALEELSQEQAWTHGDAEAGIESLSKALDYDLDPYRRAELLALRADMYYYGIGDAESALQDFEEAYEFGEHDPWIYESAADVAARSGNFERAIGYYQRNLEEHAGDPRFLVGIGALQQMTGDLEGARGSANRALELNPDLVGAHYVLGLIALDVGNPEDALAEFETVQASRDVFESEWLWSFPFFSSEWGRDILYDQARAAYAMQDIEAALAYLNELIGEEGIGWAPPYVLKGDILAEQGDRAGAREAYQRALDTAEDPDLRADIEQRMLGLSK